MKVRKIRRYDNGLKAKSSKFYAVFADHMGVMRRLALFEDRKASEEAGRKVDRLRWHMTGIEWALLYRLAVETGFRRGELASLTNDSFELAGMNRASLWRQRTRRHVAYAERPYVLN